MNTPLVDLKEKINSAAHHEISLTTKTFLVRSIENQMSLDAHL
jgi:hypothetical protein